MTATHSDALSAAVKVRAVANFYAEAIHR